MKRRKKGFLFIVKIWERMKMYLSTGLNLFHAFSCYTVFLFFKVIFLSSLRLAASRAGRRRCCCCSSFFFFTFWKTAKIGNPKVQIWKQNQTLSAQLLGKVSQRRDEGDEEIFTTPTPGAAGIGSEHMRVAKGSTWNITLKTTILLFPTYSTTLTLFLMSSMFEKIFFLPSLTFITAQLKMF